MRDPHVVSLSYRFVETDKRASFENDAPPVEYQEPAFSAQLAEGVLTVTMHEHHASEATARAAVKQRLHAWEVRHALSVGRPEFRFVFERAEVIDRDPPPPPTPGEPREVRAAPAVAVAKGIAATPHVTRSSYPEPPADFALDPDVETLWTRWEGYQTGREPLQSMAYFCLTVLEMYGDRPGAVARFAISDRVLGTVGRLSFETGDQATARKASPRLRPATPQEREWLEAAVKAMVRRAGQVAANPNAQLPQITMADLPPL